MSRSAPDLARALRAFQQDWGLVAVSAIAGTDNGNLKLTVAGDVPVIALEDDHGNVTVLNVEALQ